MAIVRNEMSPQEMQAAIKHHFGKPEPKPKRVVDNSAYRDMCKRAATWLRGTMGCSVAAWKH